MHIRISIGVNVGSDHYWIVHLILLVSLATVLVARVQQLMLPIVLDAFVPVGVVWGFYRFARLQLPVARHSQLKAEQGFDRRVTGCCILTSS